MEQAYEEDFCIGVFKTCYENFILQEETRGI